MLSDKDIRHRLEDGNLEVKNIDDLDRQLQPASLDIRLADTFETFSAEANPGFIDPSFEGDRMETISETVQVEEGTSFVIDRKEFVLASTKEYVSIPPNLVSFVEGRSSLGRLGIQIHSTAGLIDPGFEGNITLELYNSGPQPVLLHPDMRIGQLTFSELSSECMNPYGDLNDSKYNKQSGPTRSRISDDPEFQDD